MPTASVVIPTFNRSDLIGDAINSVLGQTYHDFELIVVDDGSTDDTRTTVKAFQADPRVKYLYMEERGPSAARNAGIREAKGKFIGFLDSDDLWAPEKLEIQVNCMEATGADVVYCDFQMIDSHGLRLNRPWRKPASQGSLYEDLLYANVVSGGSAALVRSSRLFEVGLFDENLWASEDQELWQRLALLGCRFVHVHEVLVSVRWHDSNTTNDFSRRVPGLMRYLDKLDSQTPPEYRHHLPEVIYRSCRFVAVGLLSARQFSEAAGVIRRILRLGPKYGIRFLGYMSVALLERGRRIMAQR